MTLIHKNRAAFDWLCAPIKYTYFNYTKYYTVTYIPIQLYGFLFDLHFLRFILTEPVVLISLMYRCIKFNIYTSTQCIDVEDVGLSKGSYTCAIKLISFVCIFRK